MKVLKWAVLVWATCSSLVVLFAFFSTKSNRTETHIFCAYNRLFVEFDENGRLWGTIMIDYDGKPIPCKEEDVKLENTI